jgi:hypothetical protein
MLLMEPLIAIMSVLPQKDISIGTTASVFFQYVNILPERKLLYAQFGI